MNFEAVYDEIARISLQTAQAVPETSEEQPNSPEAAVQSDLHRRLTELETPGTGPLSEETLNRVPR